MTGSVYILKCSDGTYYVGSTRNIDHRLRQHQNGEGAEYTKRRRPVELVFCRQCTTVSEAFGLEKRIHGWSRAKRQALIDGRFDLLPKLSKKTNFRR